MGDVQIAPVWGDNFRGNSKPRTSETEQWRGLRQDIQLTLAQDFKTSQNVLKSPETPK